MVEPTPENDATVVTVDEGVSIPVDGDMEFADAMKEQGVQQLTEAQFKKLIAMMNKKMNKDIMQMKKKERNRKRNKNARKARRANRLRAGK